MSGVEPKANDAKALPGIKRRSVLSSLRVVPVLATVAAVALAAAARLSGVAILHGLAMDARRHGPRLCRESRPSGRRRDRAIADRRQPVRPQGRSPDADRPEELFHRRPAGAGGGRADASGRRQRERRNDAAVEAQRHRGHHGGAADLYQPGGHRRGVLPVGAREPRPGARSISSARRSGSPVNGYVTNLSAQLGDYANVGALQLSIVNSDSYWVDAYFEETALGRIHEGDAATIKLMGYSPLLRGRVQGLARGINVPNAQPDASGLASVNPIFTFVRLAQRVPVRIHIDEVPEGVKLVAGLTATVQIEPYKAPPVPGPTPASEPRERSGAQARSAADPRRAAPQAAPARWLLRKPPARAPARPLGASRQSAGPACCSTASRSAGAAEGAAATERVAAGGADAGAHELAVSAPPSAQASAAAAAAAADLKTLEEQIAANPPSGSRLPADCDQSPERLERGHDAAKRIPGADLRPFRRSRRGARAEAPIS